MALIRTLVTLRDMCKEFSDLENNTHISDAKWNRRMSLRYGELWQIAVDGGGRYFETESSITATGAASYAEPSDILHILEITRVDGSYRRRLTEIQPQHRADLIGLTGDAGFWEFSDNVIILYPNPSSGTYKVLYVPQPSDLTTFADSDNVDVCCSAGEQFLVWSVVADALAKAETNNAHAIQERERAREGLQTWAGERALLYPRARIPEDNDINRRVGPDGWERW